MAKQKTSWLSLCQSRRKSSHLLCMRMTWVHLWLPNQSFLMSFLQSCLDQNSLTPDRSAHSHSHQTSSALSSQSSISCSCLTQIKWSSTVRRILERFPWMITRFKTPLRLTFQRLKFTERTCQIETTIWTQTILMTARRASWCKSSLLTSMDSSTMNYCCWSRALPTSRSL